MTDQCNPYQTSTCFQYLDANNLYGWVMIQILPTYGVTQEKKVNQVYPRKNISIDEKRRKKFDVEFRSRCQISQSAAQEAWWAAIFSRENKNSKSGQSKTKS